MLARVLSLGLTGIEGYTVAVEANVSGGMPVFEVVGLPDAAVRESRERVRAALHNSGFS
ncbi:MAG: ATP-binding protein, partial [Oscillospiraceae bacterium]|nr:ATP-binding protein [Oscillospiraceae bacterium]